MATIPPKRCAFGLGLAIGVIFMAALIPGARAQQPEPSCRYIEAGPQGPRGNRLVVHHSTAQVLLRRSQRRIVVEHAQQLLPCRGITPTVRNVDRIVVRGVTTITIRLELRDGPLAPGATAEGRGAEIEIYGTSETGGPDARAGLTVAAGPGDNKIALGSSGTWEVANLNAFHEKILDPDVFLKAAAPGNGRISVIPRAGDDVVDARGWADFEPSKLPFFFSMARGADRIFAGGGSGIPYLIGGDGPDRIVGTALRDRISGGGGADQILGGPGNDGIYPGGGRDQVYAGPGDDVISLNDGQVDRLDCYLGEDRVRADPDDQLIHCEDVSTVRMPG